MANYISRRNWLKTSVTLAAGAGISPRLLASVQPQKRPGDVIWLNSNENAFGPSEATRNAMAEALSLSNRYPDEILPVLKKQLADFYQVQTDHICLGAGGSEILTLSAQLAAAEKGHVVTADPTFQSWYRQAETFGLSFKRVPLTNERLLNTEAMLSSIGHETRMVYVVNPNNPTGTAVADAQLREFVSACSRKCLVLVDEAYTEFAEIPSLKDLAITNPNVIVLKTFSKIYGLAGARIGYAIAHPDTARKLTAFQTWSGVNISAVSATAAMAALKDQAFVAYCKEQTSIMRNMCYDTFKALQLDYIPSQTSFILFNVDRIASVYSQKMKEKNIWVQHRDHFGGKWSRVSMGTPDEMKQFCAALKEFA